MLRFCEHFGFILFHPQNFRCSETCQRDITSDLNKFFLPNDLMNLITLTLRSLVIPQNGWTQNIARFIEQDKPMHLTGQTDRSEAFPTDARLLQHGLDTRRYRLPPLMRILLRPQWLWRLQRMRMGGHRNDFPFFIDE